jgi:hypothetical protein
VGERHRHEGRAARSLEALAVAGGRKAGGDPLEFDATLKLT